MNQFMGASGRRAILSGALAAPAMLAAAPGQAAERKQATGAVPLYAYVGTFTTEQSGGRGEGISVYRVDPATSGWTHVQTLGDLVNPSYLIVSRDQRHLYSVHG